MNNYTTTWIQIRNKKAQQTRLEGTFFMLLFTAFCSVLLLALSLPASAQSFPQESFALVNQARHDAGVQQLSWNDTLAAAAQAKVDDMIANGYFAHVAPSGKLPEDFLHENGYEYYAMGENLAYGFTEPQETHDALMTSPTHKRNILQPLFTEVGIASGTKLIKGRTMTYVVQMYASPLTIQPYARTQRTIQSRPVLRLSLADLTQCLLPAADSSRRISVLRRF